MVQITSFFCTCMSLLPSRFGAYVSSPWIWAGPISALTNRIWRKWHSGNSEPKHYKILAASVSSLLEPSFHVRTKPKQSPAEAHMEEIQALALPRLPWQLRLSSLQQPVPASNLVTEPSWGRSCTMHPSCHHMEQRKEVFSKHCPHCKYTCEQINDYCFKALVLGWLLM